MISKGSIVVVESRTWPGSNKPGGVARVTAVHHHETTSAANGAASPKKKYDVSYVLGGKEKGVDEEYVTLQSSSDDEDDDKKKRSSDLRISTSTASLALSASPLQTPKNNEIIDEPTKGKDTSPMYDSEEQERRKRKNSIQEDILMGEVGGSGNSSYNSLGAAVASAAIKQEKEPLVKKMKIEATDEAETSHDDDDSAVSSSSLCNHHKTAIWSARKNLEIKDKNSSTSASAENEEGGKSSVSAQQHATSLKRWRSHQIAEDYIGLASAMVLPPTTHLNNTFGYVPHLGQYPIEQVTALGYLTSPLRRPTVIEKWAPYEIATFEAALALHGKHFHHVQKWVKTKNTKEVIEFYYIWKKTSHYRRWKSTFCEEMESVCSSDGEDEDMMDAAKEDGGGNSNGGARGSSPVRGGR